MRQTLAVLALSALTAGCTVTTHGTVVADPTLGHAPRPLPASALSGLLLNSGAVGSIMGASLQVVDSADTMYTNRPLDDGCLIWGEAQEFAYQGTGWTAVRVQELKDHHEQADHIAYQAVVAFPAALGANNFYASQVTGWAHCDNRRVDLHDSTDPSPHYWSLTKANAQDGVLTITRVQEGGQGWSCQRALTAVNNIVVDVSACANNIDDRGAQIAKQIAKNIQ